MLMLRWRAARKTAATMAAVEYPVIAELVPALFFFIEPGQQDQSKRVPTTARQSFSSRDKHVPGHGHCG